MWAALYIGMSIHRTNPSVRVALYCVDYKVLFPVTGYHSYLTTNRNIVYLLADGRGSGLKGQDILYSLNNALGTVEIEDHLVITRYVLIGVTHRTHKSHGLLGFNLSFQIRHKKITIYVLQLSTILRFLGH